MAQIALIDDDPVETLVLEGLLEHAGGDHAITAYTSVEAFIAGSGVFDLVLLDRRVPPHQTFESSLAAMADSAYRGPVVMVTAGGWDEAGMQWRGGLEGPINKAELLTPEALSRLIEASLQP